jgi:hypothetical protein
MAMFNFDEFKKVFNGNESTTALTIRAMVLANDCEFGRLNKKNEFVNMSKKLPIGKFIKLAKRYPNYVIRG